MIDDLDLESCDLIQLDVEGYEHEVLTGAIKTIEKFKPTISVERGGGLIDFLKPYGYQEVARTFDDVVFKV